MATFPLGAAARLLLLLAALCSPRQPFFVVVRAETRAYKQLVDGLGRRSG